MQNETCRFCGQTLSEGYICDCVEATDEHKATVNRDRTLRDAEMQIKHMFTGGGLDEGYGWLSVSDDTAELLNMIARMVYDEEIKAASIQLTPVNKATIGKTARGKLTIARDDTIKNKQEV